MPPSLRDGISDIIRVDHARVVRIGQMMQYSLIYSLMGYISGYVVDRILGQLDNPPNKFTRLIYISIHIIIMAITFFYARKIAKLFPCPLPATQCGVRKKLSYDSDILFAIFFFAASGSLKRLLSG